MILIRKKRRKKLEKDVKLLRISSVRTKEVDLVKKKKKKIGRTSAYWVESDVEKGEIERMWRGEH